MRLVSAEKVKQAICDVTNYAIEHKEYSKSDIQHRLIYEIEKMQGVIATDEQMLELCNREIEFEEVDE